MTWTKLDTAAGVTGTGPSARFGHSMTSVGINIYLFGGQTNSGERITEVGGGGRRWELVGLGVWLGHGGWHGTEVLRVFWVDCLRVDKRKGSFSLDLGSPVCRCRCDGRACGDYRGRDPV